jgi:hypothetical protein
MLHTHHRTLPHQVTAAKPTSGMFIGSFLTGKSTPNCQTMSPRARPPDATRHQTRHHCTTAPLHHCTTAPLHHLRHLTPPDTTLHHITPPYASCASCASCAPRASCASRAPRARPAPPTGRSHQRRARDGPFLQPAHRRAHKLAAAPRPDVQGGAVLAGGNAPAAEGS